MIRFENLKLVLQQRDEMGTALPLTLINAFTTSHVNVLLGVSLTCFGNMDISSSSLAKRGLQQDFRAFFSELMKTPTMGAKFGHHIISSLVCQNGSWCFQLPSDALFVADAAIRYQSYQPANDNEAEAHDADDETSQELRKEDGEQGQTAFGEFTTAFFAALGSLFVRETADTPYALSPLVFRTLVF